MEEIREIKISSKEYPKSLKTIETAPEKIYIRGKFPVAKNYLGIVGTRKFTLYGKQTALEIGSQIARSGIVIISGMAEGIDTFAHQGALENNIPTIAVLGTGLDEESIYPRSNLALSRKIINQGGCLISEYPPGTKGSKITFPYRNRIIAALSQAVLVVEAKEISGSLITANYARKFNKKVFTIPGSIYSQFSAGCNALIKKGAIPVSSYQDILKEMGISKKRNKNPISDPSLTKQEKVLLETLLLESCDIDTMREKTKMSISEICSTLSELELKNKIKNLGGNIYAIKK